MHKGVQPACHCRPVHVIVRPSMSMRVLGCHCLSKLVSVCHCLFKLVSVRLCTSLGVSACHCASLSCTKASSQRVNVGQCMPLSIQACLCASLCVIVRPSLSLCGIDCPSLLVHVNVRLHHAQRSQASVSLSSSACHCPSKHVCVRPYVSLSVKACLCVSSTCPTLSVHVNVRLHHAQRSLANVSLSVIACHCPPKHVSVHPCVLMSV